jgi:hypothetical protein
MSLGLKQPSFAMAGGESHWYQKGETQVRFIRIMGAAAITAASLLTLVGATPASASPLEEVVICKVPNEVNCAAANRLGAGTVLHGVLKSGTNAVLLGFGADVTCTGSTTLGTTTSTLAHGAVTALGFTGCTETESKPCTATTERLNYLIKGELKAGHTAYEVLVTAGPSGLRPEVRLQCPNIGIDCKYGADIVLLEAIGGFASADTVLKVLQTLSGLGFCFTSATWHAEYLTLCLNAIEQEIGCWLRME